MKTKKKTKADFFKGKKVLLLGGLGFIGSNIIHELIKRKAKITVIERSVKKNSFKYKNNADIIDKINLIKGDAMDIKVLEKNIPGQDIIFNLLSIYPKIKSPCKEKFEKHVKFHVNFLETCRKLNNKAKIVFFGSRMEYGFPQSLPIREEHPLNPITPYGLERAVSEYYYLQYHQVHSLNTICFRISNPYGPRGDPEKEYPLLNKFIIMAVKNKTINIFGKGKEYKDYIYINDMVKAMLLCLENKEGIGQCFNCGSGKKISFKATAEKIIKIAKSGKINIIPDHPDAENNAKNSFYFDISKIKKFIDWKPETGFDNGIKKTIEYYKKII